jgi:hypothetical protein
MCATPKTCSPSLALGSQLFFSSTTTGAATTSSLTSLCAGSGMGRRALVSGCFFYFSREAHSETVTALSSARAPRPRCATAPHCQGTSATIPTVGGERPGLSPCCLWSESGARGKGSELHTARQPDGGKRLFAGAGAGKENDFQKALTAQSRGLFFGTFVQKHKVQLVLRLASYRIPSFRKRRRSSRALAASTKPLFKVFNIKMWAMPDLRQFTSRHPFARCSDVRWGD